jgi:hypothetical protein
MERLQRLQWLKGDDFLRSPIHHMGRDQHLGLWISHVQDRHLHSGSLRLFQPLIATYVIPSKCSPQDVSVSVSVLTLTFIAYDRYHAICRPLQFASKRTKAFVVIAAIW